MRAGHANSQPCHTALQCSMTIFFCVAWLSHMACMDTFVTTTDIFSCTRASDSKLQCSRTFSCDPCAGFCPPHGNGFSTVSPPLPCGSNFMRWGSQYPMMLPVQLAGGTTLLRRRTPGPRKHVTPNTEARADPCSPMTGSIAYSTSCMLMVVLMWPC